MSRNLIRQLKSLKHAEVKPSEAWLKNNRELLLSQIKNTVTPKTTTRFNFETVWQAMSIFLPYAFVHKVVRPVVVVLLIVGMGISSWVVAASASSQALPGEWLYPAKRAAEKTQVAVAEVRGDSEESTRLHVEFAKRRAIETRSIVSQNDPDKIEIASKTISDLKDEIKRVNNKLEEMKTVQTSAADIAQNVNQNAQEIKDVLKEVKVNLLADSGTSTDADDLSVQVSEVKNLAKDTAVKAVEIMVEKHLQGDTSVSKDDVKQAINDQLESAKKDANDSKQSVVEVNKVIGAVKTEVKELANDAKADSVLASTTQALSDKIDAASKQTQAAVSSTQKINTAAGITVNEGQILLSQGNLTQAVDKIKELNSATTQSEKITDDALKAVQNVLPVVAVGTEVSVSSTVVVVTTTPSSSLSIILSVSNTIKITTSTPSVTISSTPNSTNTIKR